MACFSLRTFAFGIIFTSVVFYAPKKISPCAKMHKDRKLLNNIIEAVLGRIYGLIHLLSLERLVIISAFSMFVNYNLLSEQAFGAARSVNIKFNLPFYKVLLQLVLYLLLFVVIADFPLLRL